MRLEYIQTVRGVGYKVVISESAEFPRNRSDQKGANHSELTELSDISIKTDGTEYTRKSLLKANFSAGILGAENYFRFRSPHCLITSSTDIKLSPNGVRVYST